MTREQVLALGPALRKCLRTFEGRFGDPRDAEHFGSYRRGLLSDLPRKSA